MKKFKSGFNINSVFHHTFNVIHKKKKNITFPFTNKPLIQFASPALSPGYQDCSRNSPHFRSNKH